MISLSHKALAPYAATSILRYMKRYPNSQQTHSASHNTLITMRRLIKPCAVIGCSVLLFLAGCVHASPDTISWSRFAGFYDIEVQIDRDLPGVNKCQKPSNPFSVRDGFVSFRLNGVNNFKAIIESDGGFVANSQDGIELKGKIVGGSIVATTRSTLLSASCAFSIRATPIIVENKKAGQLEGRYSGAIHLIKDFGPEDPLRKQNGGCVGPGGNKSFVITKGVLGFSFNAGTVIVAPIEEDGSISKNYSSGWRVSGEATPGLLHVIVHTKSCDLEWRAERVGS